MKYLVIVLSVFTSTLSTFSQALYDVSHITKIDLVFEADNWNELLITYYDNDLDERLVGTCKINGVLYKQVGVTFKGNSSYDPASLKNPLNIKLNHLQPQSHQGYTAIKLSNGYKDPSFIREVLAYEIGRNYMDLPLSNYAKVTVNGVYYGLFTSLESINGDYHERRLYCDNNNARFKDNPGAKDEGGSSLEYLGMDTSDYYNFYELKSNYGWTALRNLTLALQTGIPTIENQLDVDRTIWMLAFNSVLVNLDSYTGPYKENYYLIQDDNERFMPLIWGLNQSMGSFSTLIHSDGPADLTILTEMDLFLRADDPTYPLISRLLSVPRYKKMYVAHVKTILTEFFETGDYLTRATAIQAVISSEVASEPNGIYSVAQFNTNLNSTVSLGGVEGDFYGVSEVLDARTAYLKSLPVLTKDAPNITSIKTVPALVTAYAPVTITAKITDATYAYFAYRNDWQDAFKKVQMFDDGLHGDGLAGDLIYGVVIEMSAKDIQYYIYADNADAGIFSPQRAEHEFYTLIVQGDVVINEIMPVNKGSVKSPNGKYEDWLELYNNTGSAIDLSGYHLSDKPNADPLMWKFPSGSIIDGNGYLIVWCDNDLEGDGLHANFKLSANGESVLFSDALGFEINRVKFPTMYESTTYGRYPNGTGPFIRMFETFSATNSFTSLGIEEDISLHSLLLYPNPARDLVYLKFSGESDFTVQIFNLAGQMVLFDNQESNSYMFIGDLDPGVYFVTVPALGIVEKLIKQ